MPSIPSGTVNSSNIVKRVIGFIWAVEFFIWIKIVISGGSMYVRMSVAVAS